MSKKEYTYVSLRKKKIKSRVIYTKDNAIIQKMISDATSKDIDAYIHLKPEDIDYILYVSGSTSTIAGTGKGDNAHTKSIYPLVKHYEDCKNIKAILICFSIHETFPIMEIKEAMDGVYKVFNQDEEIIFSVLIDNTLAIDEVVVNSIVKRH